MKHHHLSCLHLRTASAAALLALAAATLSAQSSSSTSTTPPRTDSNSSYSDRNNRSTNTDSTGSTVTSPSNTTTDKSNANPNYTTAANQTSPSPLKRSDEKFISKFSQASDEELRLSQVAAERATNPQVKQFAQELVSAHQGSSQELQHLAQQGGVMLPTGKEAKEEEKWRDKDAKDFDKDYINRMVKLHKESVDLCEDRAKKPEDAQVASFASKQLPVLTQHLSRAQELKKQID